MIIRVQLTKQEIEELVIRHVKEAMGLDDRPKLQVLTDLNTIEVAITEK
jgi:hypothetical protein